MSLHLGKHSADFGKPCRSRGGADFQSVGPLRDKRLSFKSDGSHALQTNFNSSQQYLGAAAAVLRGFYKDGNLLVEPAEQGYSFPGSVLIQSPVDSAGPVRQVTSQGATAQVAEIRLGWREPFLSSLLSGT